MKSSAISMLVSALLVCLQISLLAWTVRAQTPQSSEKPAVFRVKYISEGAVYIDAGRNAGLREGMKLSVVAASPDGALSDGLRFRGDEHIAELSVTSVADASAVCEIDGTPKADLAVGQVAFLSPESVQQREQVQSAVDAAQYPIVITFTYGDPLDEELREVQERKVLDENPAGRIRGRFGVDYGGTIEPGGFDSRQVGLVIDADMTRLGGTYWNFTGYWRGNYTTSSSGSAGTSATLTDLINRTYHLGFTYQNPYSAVTVGVGRLFLPYAPSLSTIDGGYFARKVTHVASVGFFAGSTPDPTSWNYNPDQRLAGTFVNFETGGFDRTRLYTTVGVAVTSIQWRVARQFAFLENNFSWKRYLTLYNSMQVDNARNSPLPNGGSNPTAVSQSYSSLHIQPVARVTFGVNHNYFRNLPTFDPKLIGTGLLDQYLFQGFSGDVRIELVKRIAVYSSLGRSKVSTDSKNSLNQSYGITFARIWKTGLFADAHYSKFDSAFGGGQYEALSLSRNVTESFRLQFLGGHQLFNSSLSTNTHSNFINATADCNLGSRYFVEGIFGWYQGNVLNYRQWSTVFGYRFGGLRH